MRLCITRPDEWWRERVRKWNGWVYKRDSQARDEKGGKINKKGESWQQRSKPLISAVLSDVWKQDGGETWKDPGDAFRVHFSLLTSFPCRPFWPFYQNILLSDFSSLSNKDTGVHHVLCIVVTEPIMYSKAFQNRLDGKWIFCSIMEETFWVLSVTPTLQARHRAREICNSSSCSCSFFSLLLLFTDQ